VADQQAQVTNDQADAFSRKFGIVLMCIGFAIAYFVWPDGATDVSLAAMTLGMLLRVIAAIGLAIASVVLAAMFAM
jgi:hypothetical protein